MKIFFLIVLMLAAYAVTLWWRRKLTREQEAFKNRMDLAGDVNHARRLMENAKKKSAVANTVATPAMPMATAALVSQKNPVAVKAVATPVKVNYPSVNLRDVLYGRRSIRTYTDEVLDKATINSLLDAAVHAPTAVHEEPWQFVVIQDKALLKRLSDRAKQLVKADLEKNSTEQGKHLLGVVGNPEFNIFYDASTLIAIAVKPMSNFVAADAWLAAENLLLSAYGMGLGSCVIGFAVAVLNTPEVKQELGIPAELQVIAPLIIGWPRGVTPLSPRKPPEVIVWK